MAKMEMEMEVLGKDYKACEDVFAKKMLLLTVFRRYVVRLVENDKINCFIESCHSGIHAGLEVIVANETGC